MVDETSPAGGRVCIVDDEELVLRSVARIVGRATREVRTFESAAELLDVVEAAHGAIDCVISDLHMPGMDGLELVRTLKTRWPEIPVLILTADSAVRNAVEAMRAGAYDYLIKPIADQEEVLLTLGRALERGRLVRRNRDLERRLDVADRFEGIVGTAPQIREIFSLVESVAPTDATVLLLGESGTGKDLLARAIHARSARRERAYVPVNCSALTETLLESELFGHVRGAFSGAHTSRIGVFEEATGGTLFLDEIGDISPGLQVRLLRALQEGEIKPVGSTEIRRVDVRVVAATNRDLRDAVRAGRFREDLYYRLNVVPLDVPPLRRRTEDIPLLAQHFLEKYARKFGKAVKRLDPAALEALQSYRWPGNIRELENAIQRAVVLAAGEAVLLEQLPQSLREAPVRREATRSFDLPFSEAKQAAVVAFERRYLEDVLTRAGGNVAEAARLCNLDKANFRRLLRRHDVDVGELRAERAQAAAERPRRRT